MRLVRVILCVWVFQLLLFSSVSARETVSGEKKSPFFFGFSHRFRFVTWDNPIHLDRNHGSGSTFTRHRTSFSVSYQPADTFSVFFKVTNEFRLYIAPKNRPFNLNELFVDNLSIKSIRPGRLPVELSLGRQNIMLGEGFVVMDGHPLDGSRSIYFNAARLDLFLQENRKLILFCSYQPETDTLLPVLNSRSQTLIEQPEEGIGLYYTEHLGRSVNEAYLIRKNIRATAARPAASRIDTAGGRMTVPVTEGFSLTGEAAYQWGTMDRENRSAFGGIVHLDYETGERLPAPGRVTVGGFYLSGDNPSTGGHEGWDPLFSRWPKWSESYILTLMPEYDGRVAYWSNISSVYGELVFSITEAVDLSLTFHRLMAPQLPSTLSTFASGSGRTRGNLLVAILNFQMMKGLTGHIRWETFAPGDYYDPGADGFHWLRVELMYRF
ncbi:MAG: hypothetical protein KKC69_02515 [Acidobacteria bacterium]|nr:hypothetical protein [Acidobacteriota bacterium]